MAKTPLVAAISLVAFFLAGTSALGTPLPLDASPSDTVAWLQAREAAVPIVVACYALSLIPFLVLAAWVRRALPEVHGYAFSLGVAAFAAQVAVSTWFLAGTAVHADTIQPQTARSLLDVGAFFGPVLTTTDVVLAGAVGLAALGDGPLPRWLGWLSLVFAAEQLAELATVWGRTGFAAPGGDWNNLLGAGLLMIWVLALGWAVGRRAPATGAAGFRAQASA